MAKEHIEVRVDGPDVLLISNGRLVTTMPAHIALELSRLLHRKAKVAEEARDHQGLILDTAILLRKGIPVGLTNNPRIQHEAGKVAAWDSNIRRYIPGGVQSQEACGTPTISHVRAQA